MKSKEEIEQLAQEVHYEFQNQGLDADGCFNQYQGYIKGYTQCQEDMAIQTISNGKRRIAPFKQDSMNVVWENGYQIALLDNKDKKYTEEDIINIVNKSRETGLTAEYLILSLNKQD